ncbi:hypothetical protein CkaCkLH20_00503 [Colletotrichum karsti]|uniref:Uncharacterized protein n=1 Tax=Colletotrichum karsti TaxID=1095194 RepID=A0A9P6LRD3_9PEZI|nr:uncharacterized protein CkaCkLH20_00503 [Colletotrichum karsti]KAF9882467.1 hypothetical protein CkaCkLH20_00503 [Colletotrichum karsti]
MTPPCVVFDASELPRRVQADLKGKKRKLEGGADVNLSKCALRVMTQYRCMVENPEVRDSRVGCWPVQRFFRQCQDKKGTFTVETTAWEGPSAAAKVDSKGSQATPDKEVGKGKGQVGVGEQRTYQQWSQAWGEE